MISVIGTLSLIGDQYDLLLGLIELIELTEVHWGLWLVKANLGLIELTEAQRRSLGLFGISNEL